MIRENEHIENLLMAYLLNELAVDKAQEVDLWLASSSENQQKLDEVLKIWEASQHADELSFDSNKAWNKVSKKMTSKPFYQETWLRVAAAILILFGSATLFWETSSTNTPVVLYAQNEVVNETLIDGSEITLNANSNLSYTESFNTKNREVTLEGEAFFDIERDETKPFIINLAQCKVTVLGTSFNIKSNVDDELVRVFVKSGVVRFEYLSNDSMQTYLTIELHAGDRVVYNKETHQLESSTSQNSSNNLDMYWINKELIFDGIELGKVSEILEIVYDVQISFTDIQSKKCLLTANFQNADINQIMTVISTTFELELEQLGNQYSLKG